MVKDYTVLDGMISNQTNVLKAAYERGYAHGVIDGKDSFASVLAKASKEKYDDGFHDGYSAGSDAVMENVVKKLINDGALSLPNGETVVTQDIVEKSLQYIERLLKTGLGKKKSLEYLKKFIESEGEN